MARRESVFDESVDPSTMEDVIVVGSFKRNPDGSITVSCQIDVIDHKTGECWGVDSRVIRLPKRR